MYLDLDSSSGAVSDETLMADVAEGKPDALQELYRRHHTYLRSIVLGILRDPTEADDLLQEIFLELWLCANTYSPRRGKPIGWLVILAKRRAIDKVRRLTSYRGIKEKYKMESDTRNSSAAASAPTPLVATESECDEDLRSYLVNLLGRLPDNQKEIVEKTFFSGWSQRQISLKMQIPLGTVKTRLELGLRKLVHFVAPARHQII
jgi:RNA polymerase sigma-70 factor (ECF subfamily)